MQEVHRSSQEGVTSHCQAEWGYYWFLEVECPLENSASIISILPCFQVCFFFPFCVFEVECPQQNTDALTLVATLVCHDLVYFCSQRVSFMTLYGFFAPLAFVLLEHEHARLPVLQHAEKLPLLLHPAHVLPRLSTVLLLEQLLMRKR